MNDAFTTPDGFISVTFTDRSPRPKQLYQVSMERDLLGPQIGDIGLAWYPNYPDLVHKLRPVHPNWIGVMDAAFEPSGVNPVSWLPTYLDYLPAPRLHTPATKFGFDPLSGEDMQTALQMGWDPTQKAPLVTRPKFAATQFAFVTPPAVITSGLECVEMVDEQGASPTLTSQTTTAPTLTNQSLSVPTLTGQDVC